ncbi:MAG: ubiquinone biosynthesis regulatory protein kinase UbiB [Gammaproteobacteria bacterium]|nr:ubiquinone biosynthesis regulatory protein kinase UbiB [Gammaproteobacteria bacterium]
MNFLRVIRILSTFIRLRLDRNIPNEARKGAVATLLWILKLFPEPRTSGPESARLALEQLGPIFIKFGQILSTRKDLFSDEMSQELQKLQDQVPPFDGGTAVKIIESEIKGPIPSVFTSFDSVPLASASLAQVHAATMAIGPVEKEVVVKVIRPGIQKVIERDIKLMYFCANLLGKFWPDAKRLHPVTLVKDYESVILGELDLQLEADNSKRLRDNWLESGKLFVPEVYDNHSTSRIMVMERIYGVTATDLPSLRDKSVDLKKLAHLGVEIFFSQVFEDNFFHADMHPGNVFVDITDPDDPTYIALDCAIMGSLTENDKDYLARNLLAFFHRDYDEVARLHVKSGWVPFDTDINEFSAVIRRVCDPFFQKPIKDISFGIVLLELFDTARKYNMEVQPQLVLLQKTLINIEGMGRQIYPDLDLWETAAPFMERWMKDRIGLTGLIKRIYEKAPRWLDQLPEIPDLAYNAMAEIQDLAAQNRAQIATLTEVKQALQEQTRRAKYQRIGGLALIGAILSLVAPTTGYAAEIDPIIPGSVLGMLGIYWMYIHS